MPLAAASPTGLRILTKAELLFADRGYAAVSLRQITSHAQVNLAAVNYHFYDKPGLFAEIIRQRLDQLAAERLALLDVVLARAVGEPAPQEEILDALARPMLVPSPDIGPSAARLLGRLLTEPQPFTEPVVRERFEPTIARFGQALRRHQPTLPAADFLWRLTFVVGALHHTVVTLPALGQHTRGLCRAEDCEGALRNFTRFAAKALSC